MAQPIGEIKKWKSSKRSWRMGMNSGKFENLQLSEKIEAIEQVVKEKILPLLAFDGGFIQIIDIREGEEPDGKNGNKITYIYIRYGGACMGCAMASGATLYAIEESLKRELETDKIQVIIV